MRSVADLHVHSRFSDRPSDWLLRRLGSPECFTEPMEIYQRARRHGMRFVTISDHDAIDGALEIAHLPDTFVSCELTTSFPEDDCRFHLLVFGLDEASFADLTKLQGNVYEVRDYLYDHGIAHAVAHPLYAVSRHFSLAHLERLAVLFRHFEAINGTREPQAGRLARAWLESLTPESLAALAGRHGLEPRGEEPWRKHFTGGSDDHSGLYISSAYTETPPAADVGAFLAHLAAGRTTPRGDHGNSLQLARNFSSIAYRYYRERLLGGGATRDGLVGELIARLVGEVEAGPLSRGERLALFAARWLRPRGRTMGELDRALLRDLEDLATGALPAIEGSLESRSFGIAADLSERLTFGALRTASRNLRKGRLTEALQSLSSLGPAALCAAPYLASFHTQHRDRELLAAVEADLPGRPDPAAAPRVWFTDTFDDVNGVAVTVREAATAAGRIGRRLLVFTSLREAPAEEPSYLRNFAPIGDVRVPEYADLRLVLPPYLRMIEACERLGCAEVVISTPGPVGLVGLAAARALSCPVTGIYHTDFPAYVESLTGSSGAAEAMRRYLRWFYGQLDRILVPSHAYLEELLAAGYEAERLQILPRGVDRGRFHPRHRDAGFWTARGLRGGHVLLYVGRVSREKNLNLLLEAWQRLRDAGHDVDLAIVGDGPQREELAQHWAPAGVLFTGYLEGRELGTAYASADIFAFPSGTDTFGNVVLEAQAAGLPVVVVDRGGAPETVRASGGGRVVPEDAAAMAAAVAGLLAAPAERAAMSRAGLDFAGSTAWSSLAACLWREAAEPAARSENPAGEPLAAMAG